MALFENLTNINVSFLNGTTSIAPSCHSFPPDFFTLLYMNLGFFCIMQAIGIFELEKKGIGKILYDCLFFMCFLISILLVRVVMVFG
jgi:cellulose synthase/poly-beta-1,6-N-acetylglucosamine synthase-like glycosyltransferase